MNQFHFSLKLLATIILLHLSSNIKAQALPRETSPGDKKITIIADKLPISEIFKSITKQTGLRFSYNNKDINKDEKITAPFVDLAVDKVLKHIFAGKPLSWVYIDNIVRIGKSTSDQGPSIILDRTKEKASLDSVPLIDVSGRVVDAKGRSIAGATVSLRGQSRGQGTDNNGNFSFVNIPSNAVLMISSIGYETKQLKLAGQRNVSISLDSSIVDIQTVDIVSTGYQTIPRERATGSFNQITNSLYNEQVGTNALDRLSAVANGLTVLRERTLNNQIAIRGLSTFAGPKNPLIILDNFPYEGDINNINPNDIESITLLKDAAAASIWGARAGNGVIVITTKKGKFNQKLKIEVNTNVTVTEKPDLYYLQKMSSSDFIDAEKFLFDKGFYNPYLQAAPFFYQTPIVDILEKERKQEITPAEATNRLNAYRGIDNRSDYLKYMYQKGVNQQYAVNLKGGSNNLAWILSLGTDRNASELDAGFNRYNVRLDNIYKVSRNVEITAGVYYTQSKLTSGKTAYGGIPGTVSSLPYIAFSDKDGNPLPIYNYYRQTFTDTAGRGRLLDWRYYPLEDYKHTRSSSAIQNIIGKVGIKYTILTGLSVDLKYQFEKENKNDRILNDEQSFYARDLINQFSQINYSTGVVTRPVPLGGILDKNINNITSHNLRGQVNFDKAWGNNSVVVIAGGEIRDLKSDGEMSRTYGYNDDLLTFATVDYSRLYPHFEPAFGSNAIPSTNFLNGKLNRFVSVYANAAYTYNNKYTVSVSGRRDASNLFGVKTNDKWSPLWSGGFAWNISNENFYNVGLFPLLKLRATYGFSGNVLPNLASSSTLSYRSDKSIYTGGPIATVNNYYNPELRWEKVGMLNIGVDFEMKQGTISGSLEYFRKNGVDLYGPAPIDRTLGLSSASIVKNYANLVGNGVDVLLNTNNLRGSFKWQTNFNFSYYKDKVTKYLLTSSLRADNFIAGSAPVVGFPRYSLFKYKWAGLNPNTGDPQGYLKGVVSTNYRALNGDSATFSDLVYKGNALPTVYGSIGNNFNWKGFNLNVRILYQLGYYFQRESIDYDALYNSKKGHADFTYRWKAKGDENFTNIPSMTYPFNSSRELFYRNSEILTTKGDHIRLQYVSLGYEFSQLGTVKLPFERLKIFVIANNLGLLWKANKEGIDPSYTGNQIPPARSYAIGINMNM